MLVVGGLLMMMPFLWMILTSLKTRAEVFGAAPFTLPTGPHFENYAKMWNALPERDLRDFFLNSLKLSTLNTIGQLISCSMAAFAFAVLPFRGRGPLFALILATLIIPFQVVLVPNFILYRLLPHPTSESGNWIGTQEPLWVGAFLGGAFGIFLLRQFFLTVPRELAEAARVDGANPWQIYRHIYLPLSKPALATLAIFTFMWTWNDLIDPLIYLRHLDQYTTTVGLAFFQGQFVGKWPEMMAGALVSLAPMIILFVAAQQVLRPRHRAQRPQGMTQGLPTCAWRLPAPLAAARPADTLSRGRGSRPSTRTTISASPSAVIGRAAPLPSWRPRWTRPGSRRSSTSTAGGARRFAARSTGGSVRLPGRVAVFAGLDYDELGGRRRVRRDRGRPPA